MYRFDAEDPRQSLYTPTTAGVIRRATALCDNTVESAIWGLISQVTGTDKA